MNAAAVCENHVKGVVFEPKCVIDDDTFTHVLYDEGQRRRSEAARIALDKELLQTQCGGRTQSERRRITSVHSHTPVPTLTFPSLILSDILGTRLHVIEAKKEKSGT